VRHGSHDFPVRPAGYRKRKSRLKASRSPVYIPTSSDSKREASVWLKAR
jgi:hypothetical protein